MLFNIQKIRNKISINYKLRRSVITNYNDNYVMAQIELQHDKKTSHFLMELLTEELCLLLPFFIHVSGIIFMKHTYGKQKTIYITYESLIMGSKLSQFTKKMQVLNMNRI